VDPTNRAGRHFSQDTLEYSVQKDFDRYLQCCRRLRRLMAHTSRSSTTMSTTSRRDLDGPKRESSLEPAVNPQHIGEVQHLLPGGIFADRRHSITPLDTSARREALAALLRPLCVLTVGAESRSGIERVCRAVSVSRFAVQR
jgi:hypothetical protein